MAYKKRARIDAHGVAGQHDERSDPPVVPLAPYVECRPEIARGEGMQNRRRLALYDGDDSPDSPVVKDAPYRCQLSADDQVRPHQKPSSTAPASPRSSADRRAGHSG